MSKRSRPWDETKARRRRAREREAQQERGAAFLLRELRRMGITAIDISVSGPVATGVGSPFVSGPRSEYG